jgi:probable HAF family extracellular repeat protein
MKLSRTLILAAFATMFIMNAQAEPRYHVIPIISGYAQGINDKGDVVGAMADVGTFPGPVIAGHAFLYTNGNAHKKATFTDLGVYNAPIPRQYQYKGTVAYGINNSGIIVGQATDLEEWDASTAIVDAFMYKNGKLSIIAEGSLDGGQTSTCTAINNKGDIVGGLDAGQFLFNHYSIIEQAFLYSNGIVTPLGALEASDSSLFSIIETYSYATGINNSGQIVGVSTVGTSGDPFVYSGFLWMNGKMHAIGSSSFRPNAINDNGWIAGSDSSGAVLYVYGLTIKIGAGEAVSLNNSGVVVGDVRDVNTGISTGAFLYVIGQRYDLNTLVDGGWKITEVGQINDAGQIAATGTMPGSTVTYALLLTPNLNFLKF